MVVVRPVVVRWTTERPGCPTGGAEAWGGVACCGAAQVEEEVRVGVGHFAIEGDLARRVIVVEPVPALVLGLHEGHVVPAVDRSPVLHDPVQPVLLAIEH